MLSLRAAWQALSLRRRLVAASGLLGITVLAGATVVVLVALSSPQAPVAAAAPTASPRPAPTPTPTPSPPPTPSPSPSPTPSPAPEGPDELLGTDGRFTVLLLGSDYRPSKPGNRMDAIMVVSVDPVSGESAAFSVPRDTEGFPMPSKGTYGGKVNALYQHLDSRSGKGGDEMKKAVSRAFSIEVDHYAVIGFNGVRRMVDAVGGVDVTLDRPYRDPYYWITPRKRGFSLPAGTSHLDGDEALVLARSRKGDNDFGRARRQQILVAAALDKVRDRGVATLPRLIRIAGEYVRTDIPLTRLPELFELTARADLATARRTVFGPSRFASGRSDGSFRIKLEACREWIEENFPAERPDALWPTPTPSPSSPPASASPTPTTSPRP